MNCRAKATIEPQANCKFCAYCFYCFYCLFTVFTVWHPRRTFNEARMDIRHPKIPYSLVYMIYIIFVKRCGFCPILKVSSTESSNLFFSTFGPTIYLSSQLLTRLSIYLSQLLARLSIYSSQLLTRLSIYSSQLLTRLSIYSPQLLARLSVTLLNFWPDYLFISLNF